MLEMVNLRKAFDGKPVIVDFTARFEDGGRYCLTGMSGSGKTTLLNLLMGLIKPDAGVLRVPKGTRFSAVFQEDRLLEEATAVANVSLVCDKPRGEIERVLLALGIDEDSLPQPVSAYSGGMKRRVALCRALLAEYDVLLLDEPYKGLDADTRAAAMRLVDEMSRGKLVVLVTHDGGEATGYERVEVRGG